MRWVSPEDPKLKFVFQGVRQDHRRRFYREGQMEDGEPVFVTYDDGRTFRLSEGTFEQNTLHVVVTERDGTEHRAGEGMPE